MAQVYWNLQWDRHSVTGHTHVAGLEEQPSPCLACEHFTALWLQASASIPKHRNHILVRMTSVLSIYRIMRALDWQKISKLVVLLLQVWLLVKGSLDGHWTLFVGIILVRRIVATFKFFFRVFCCNRMKVGYWWVSADKPEVYEGREMPYALPTRRS